MALHQVLQSQTWWNLSIVVKLSRNLYYFKFIFPKGDTSCFLVLFVNVVNIIEHIVHIGIQMLYIIDSLFSHSHVRMYYITFNSYETCFNLSICDLFTYFTNSLPIL